MQSSKIVSLQKCFFNSEDNEEIDYNALQKIEQKVSEEKKKQEFEIPKPKQLFDHSSFHDLKQSQSQEENRQFKAKIPNKE